MGGQRYRRKPGADIIAIEWRGDIADIPSGWLDGSATDGRTYVEVDPHGAVIVHTLEGPARPEIGGFIARGTEDELYVIRRTVMLRNYELADVS